MGVPKRCCVVQDSHLPFVDGLEVCPSAVFSGASAPWARHLSVTHPLCASRFCVGRQACRGSLVLTIVCGCGSDEVLQYFHAVLLASSADCGYMLPHSAVLFQAQVCKQFQSGCGHSTDKKVKLFIGDRAAMANPGLENDD